MAVTVIASKFSHFLNKRGNWSNKTGVLGKPLHLVNNGLKILGKCYLLKYLSYIFSAFDSKMPRAMQPKNRLLKKWNAVISFHFIFSLSKTRVGLEYFHKVLLLAGLRIFKNMGRVVLTTEDDQPNEEKPIIYSRLMIFLRFIILFLGHCCWKNTIESKILAFIEFI